MYFQLKKRFSEATPQQLDNLFFFIAMAFVMVLGLLTSPAHAATLRPQAHGHTALHPHKAPDPQPQPYFQLTPEQEAVVDWIIDSASPKLGQEQARKIVRYTYAQAQLLNIDPMAFLSLMRLESRFNPKAQSNHGAKGLMQVRASVHQDKLKGRSPYDIQTSIDVGGRILSDCLERHDHNLVKALNCYSGGGGRAYHALYQHFQHEANHAVLLSLFNGSAGSPPPAASSPIDPLPTEEVVYQVALR